MTDLGTPASGVASEVAMAAVTEVPLGDSGTVVTVTGTVVTVPETDSRDSH